MSLTLTISPVLYQLSKNPVWAKITTNSHVSTAGVAAHIRLAISDVTATGGQTITFINSLYTVVMTIGSLDGSGKKVRTAGVLSTTLYIQQVMADLKTNYLLYRDYVFTADTYGVTLTAKNTGADYSLTDSETDASGMAFDNNTAGVTEVLRENYKIVCDTYVEKSWGLSDYEKVSNDELIPVDNVALFDISKRLNAYLSPDLPAVDMSAITKFNGLLKKYYIVYAEKYGSDPETKAIALSDIGYILRGALSREEAQFVTSFFDYLIVNNLFMTLQPREKVIKQAQLEYLNVMVKAGCTSIKLAVKSYFTDKTTETNSALLTKTSTVLYDIYTVPVGPSQITLPNTSNKTIEKYEVWIVNQSGTVISETFTYKLITKPSVDDRYFIFENSLGGWDTLRCSGENVSGIETAGTNYETVQVQGYELTDHQYSKTNSKKQDVFVQNSGWLKKAALTWLEQLLLSEKAYEYINGELVPILITSQNLEKYNSRTNLFKMQFEYKYAYNSPAPRGSLTPAEEES